MKTRGKHEHARKTIEDFRAKGRKRPLLGAVARGLNRPGSARHETNVYDLNKFAKEKEVVAVPGTVLGSGDIEKPVIVYARRFSRIAREKIEKAGGKCRPIEELENAKGKVRILG